MSIKLLEVTKFNIITKEKTKIITTSLKTFCDLNNLNFREIKKQLNNNTKRNIPYLVVRLGVGHTFTFEYK